MTHHLDLKGHRARNGGGGRAGREAGAEAGPGASPHLVLYRPLVESGDPATLRLPLRVSQAPLAGPLRKPGLPLPRGRDAPLECPQPSLGHPDLAELGGSRKGSCSRSGPWGKKTGQACPGTCALLPLPPPPQPRWKPALSWPHGPWRSHTGLLTPLLSAPPQDPAGVEAKFQNRPAVCQQTPPLYQQPPPAVSFTRATRPPPAPQRSCWWLPEARVIGE